MMSIKTYSRSVLCMGTTVSIQVIAPQSDEANVLHHISKAFTIFKTVETTCSRFAAKSEVMKLIRHVKEPVSVSPLLFEALHFAVLVANETNGIFDPTVGKQLENRGFNEHYLYGKPVQVDEAVDSGSYKDIVLDTHKKTVCLQKPMIIDLGAVAKGLAIDLAARSLPYQHFMINAGGDILVKGRNQHGELWKVGIQHPGIQTQSLLTLRVTDTAVCTSGNYARKNKTQPFMHHLVNPLSPSTGSSLLSCTAISPSAMLADALSTSAFILGAEKGINLLNDADIGGVLFDSSFTPFFTSDMEELMNYDHTF
ncbi:FAD:protein FMN transferase [Priestia megaterium]|uniref:FAD:protein FMN transferase n=1 Tax=Priestia megaterium TaxID=1404 RepID=UPI00077D9075|nr:FAD:protein FMN transferase [Priestia megaterium]